MTRITIVALFLSAVVTAQSDRDVLARIRTEGLEHSQVAPVFDMLTVNIGPRLTASPAQKRAAEWARDRLASYGLANARLEPWQFGRGWTLEKLTIEMIEPRYLPLIGYADGWSAATSGELVAAPVFLGGKAPEEVDALKAQLKGAIVMSQPMLTNFVRKDRPNPSDESYQPNGAAYATSVGNAGRGKRPRTWLPGYCLKSVCFCPMERPKARRIFRFVAMRQSFPFSMRWRVNGEIPAKRASSDLLSIFASRIFLTLLCSSIAASPR